MSGTTSTELNQREIVRQFLLVYQEDVLKQYAEKHGCHVGNGTRDDVIKGIMASDGWQMAPYYLRKESESDLLEYYEKFESLDGTVRDWKSQLDNMSYAAKSIRWIAVAVAAIVVSLGAFWGYSEFADLHKKTDESLKEAEEAADEARDGMEKVNEHILKSSQAHQELVEKSQEQIVKLAEALANVSKTEQNIRDKIDQLAEDHRNEIDKRLNKFQMDSDKLSDDLKKQLDEHDQRFKGLVTKTQLANDESVNRLLTLHIRLLIYEANSLVQSVTPGVSHFPDAKAAKLALRRAQVIVDHVSTYREKTQNGSDTITPMLTTIRQFLELLDYFAEAESSAVENFNEKLEEIIRMSEQFSVPDDVAVSLSAIEPKGHDTSRNESFVSRAEAFARFSMGVAYLQRWRHVRRAPNILKRAHEDFLAVADKSESLKWVALLNAGVCAGDYASFHAENDADFYKWNKLAQEAWGDAMDATGGNAEKNLYVSNNLADSYYQDGWRLSKLGKSQEAKKALAKAHEVIDNLIQTKKPPSAVYGTKTEIMCVEVINEKEAWSDKTEEQRAKKFEEIKTELKRARGTAYSGYEEKDLRGPSFPFSDVVRILCSETEFDNCMNEMITLLTGKATAEENVTQ